MDLSLHIQLCLKSFVEIEDEESSSERHRRKVVAMGRERQAAYWKGLVTGAWNWVAWAFPGMPTDPVVSMASQSLDPNDPITPEGLQPISEGLASTGVANIPKVSGLIQRKTDPREK
jgi:hypothetical protein